MSPGPIALVGSGEYLPVMQKVETELIAGRNSRYVQIPTAAAPEGQASLNYWIELGREQAERIGVEAVPVVAHNREDAQSLELANQIKDAGLIYLSGGNPTFLANTLRETVLWDAIFLAWQNGAALAGCSAGAMALADHIPGLHMPHHGPTRGLGVLPHIRVLPHFDKMFARIPDFFARFLRVPDGVHVIGIDEDTAIVGGPHEWVVQGEQSAWLFVDNHRVEYPTGATITLTT